MQKRCKFQSTAIGLTTEKLVKAAVEEQFSLKDAQCSRGHAPKDESSFERRGRVVRHWLRSNRRFGSSTTFERMAVQSSTLLQTDSQSALAVCKRPGSGRMKHIELKMLAVQEWLKTGRLRIHKVSYMTKSMNREKLIKFGRALNLRDEHSQQLSASQTHSIREKLENNDDEDRDRHVTTAFHIKQY